MRFFPICFLTIVFGVYACGSSDAANEGIDNPNDASHAGGADGAAGLNGDSGGVSGSGERASDSGAGDAGRHGGSGETGTPSDASATDVSTDADAYIDVSREDSSPADGASSEVGDGSVDAPTQAGSCPDTQQRCNGVCVERGTCLLEEQAILVAHDGEIDDHFGSAVALSSDGTTALVGAPDRADTFSSVGAAYVYARGTSGWTEQGELVPSDGGDSNYFGGSLALSSNGDTALISSSSGVYMFTRSASHWTEHKLSALRGGGAVALSSDGAIALVGDTSKEIDSKSFQGAAQVIVRNGNDWTKRNELTASDGAAGDEFGCAVSLSADGNTALIGAHRKTVGTATQGAAYVFMRVGDAWAQQRLILSDANGDEYAGTSVALSSDGTTALVGVPFKNAGTAWWVGAAYVFARNGNTWIEQRKLAASDGAEHDFFAWSVSLSSDGSTALVGAYAKTVDLNDHRGAAYLFSRRAGTWTDQQRLISSDGVSHDRFGRAVALSAEGSTALVGAYWKQDAANYKQGTAYIFGSAKTGP